MKHEICGFEHLHLHTHFSTLDGVSSCEDYCRRAKANNQQYLVVSDHGSQAAIPSQIRACDAYGIKSIFACELYLQPNHDPNTFPHLTAEEKKMIRKSYHLLAIAYTSKGYSNLVKLTSWAWLNGFYYKPRCNLEILKQHREGIIFTSCCINGEIGCAFTQHGYDAAVAKVEEYINLFSPNFYFEIMLLDYKPQFAYNTFLIEMSEKYNIPLVLSNDVHYAQAEDADTQLNLLLTQTGRTRAEIDKIKEKDVDGESFFELQDQNLFMKSEEEESLKWEKDYSEIIPYELFKDAKRNTVKICEKAQGVQIDRSIKLPLIPNADEILMEEIKKGFKKRNLPGTNEYKRRIVEEYDLITRKGFASYFLIQKNVIDEAKRYCQEVLGTSPSNAINPGRGSAASSLVLYTLGCVDVDAVKHGLLFSRFLNESRGKSIRYKFSDNILNEELIKF